MSKKIRAYDNLVIADTYSTITQIMGKIEQVLKDTDAKSLEDLPDSIVPTSTLFNIAVCYTIIYDALVEHSLVSNGHHTQHQSTH